ncbi:GNAT family N-acetyltransferase [Candidatus Roizmanbacteria bacterium]|nr:GNAT family N-acetyltransferase [Candidatus Roizmanbacteria bacterium]
MFTISQIEPDEIKAAKDVLSLTWRDTYEKYFSEEASEKITKKWHNPKFLTSLLKSSNVYFAKALDKKDNIIGVIIVRKNEGNALFLYSLYVHPHYQGKGIGSQLLNSALDHFSAGKKLRVECQKQNTKACGFYLKQGFKIVGEKDEEVEGVKMKTVVFEKKLK